MDHSPDVSDIEEDGLLNSILQEEAANAAIATPTEGTNAADRSADDEDATDAAHVEKSSSKNASRRKRKHHTDADWERSEREVQLTHTLFGNKEKLIQKLGDDGHGVLDSEQVTAAIAKQPVWQDSDDEGLHADDVIDYERKGAPVVRKPGKYKVYLEQTFQHVLGTPAWAKLERVPDEDSDDDQLLRTVGHLAKSTGEPGHLLPTTLQFKRMKDLNRATYAEGPIITGIAFHPTSSVALVTGKSGVATIYSIDGRKNEKLHGLQFDNFAIKSCRMTRSGSEAIFGGSKKFFYTYDLMTGDTQRTFLPRSITKMSHFELSPDGRLISVCGRFGEIHLLDTNTKELVATMKQEHVCTAMAFSASDSTQLLAHSADAEVTIFDLRQHRAIHRFNDEGCVNGSSIGVSPNGRLVATGSQQGVVNVYDVAAIHASLNPKPTKTVFNLTTAIGSTEFNHSSELLAIASNHISDAVKLVHFPSGSVYANFPGQQGNLGRPNIVRFSPQSGYLAVGNLSKEVALYRLKHFSNY